MLAGGVAGARAGRRGRLAGLPWAAAAGADGWVAGGVVARWRPATGNVELCGHRSPRPCLPACLPPAPASSLPPSPQVMRIQSRYWDCMRGLVQQQFKVLAAAAARQEQLAAMKARRQEAAGAGLGPASGSDLCGEEEEEGEAGEEVGGGHAHLHHHRHRSPHAPDGLMEETEADTPHRGGARRGWGGGGGSARRLPRSCPPPPRGNAGCMCSCAVRAAA